MPFHMFLSVMCHIIIIIIIIGHTLPVIRAWCDVFTVQPYRRYAWRVPLYR